MAFTEKDLQDLKLALAQHPEWRAELRRLVLTDELLALPQLMRELAQAQARTEARVEELAQAQARTEAEIHRLAEAQTRTEETVHLIANRQNQMRGDLLAMRYAGHAYAYFGRVLRRV